MRGFKILEAFRGCTSTMRWATLILGLFVMGGCATMDSMYQSGVKLTDPDKMTLKGDVDWVNPQPTLSLSDNMTVYLRIRNSSGSDFATQALKNSVAGALASSGYTLVNSPKKAQYVLRMNVRAYGEDASKLASGGAGALIGAGLGYGVSTNGGQKGSAALGGAVVGEMTTNVMRNRNKMIRIELVSDIVVGERIAGGVITKRNVQGADALSGRSGNAAAASGNQGSNSRNSKTTQSVETKSDFLNYDNRLVAYAQKIKLTPEEAKAFLIDKMAAAVGGVLP